MEEDRYIDLLLKEADAEITDAEQLELADWLEASEANRTKADQIRKGWEVSAQAPNVISLDLDEQYKLVREKIRRTAPSKSKTIQVKAWQIAAGILLLVGFSWISYRILQSPPTKMLVYQGPSDHLKLPDGSTIWLKQNTQFQFTDSGTVRQGRLTGRAYFEIKRDASQPFEIITTLGKITVLGTSFEIDASNVNEVIVTVSEGKVKLSNDQQETIELNPGETGKITELEIEKAHYIQPAGSWRLPPRIFNQESLGTVLRDIEENTLSGLTPNNHRPTNAKLALPYRIPTLMNSSLYWRRCSMSKLPEKVLHNFT
ncbi:MAG: FecR domain-containing protein [Saprospiraceae bacterium]|nr:FecR domain-containing protein [Saprospiraceae bacterium]